MSKEKNNGITDSDITLEEMKRFIENNDKIFCDSCGEEIRGFYENNKDGSFTCLDCSIKIDDSSEIDKGF